MKRLRMARERRIGRGEAKSASSQDSHVVRQKVKVQVGDKVAQGGKKNMRHQQRGLHNNKDLSGRERAVAGHGAEHGRRIQRRRRWATEKEKGNENQAGEVNHHARSQSRRPTQRTGRQQRDEAERDGRTLRLSRPGPLFVQVVDLGKGREDHQVQEPSDGVERAVNVVDHAGMAQAHDARDGRGGNAKANEQLHAVEQRAVPQR